MLTDILLAVAISLLCIPMCLEDWRSSLISEFWCWLMLGASWLAWVLNGRNVLSFVIMVAITLLFVLNREFKYVGDADLLCIAMYAGVFVHYGVYSPVTYMWPVVVLCLMVPYAKVYSRVHGIQWRLFGGVMMPAFPLISVSWWVTTVAFIIYNVIGGNYGC